MWTLLVPFTATRLQATTYLLGVCLFSISFLVFLNSAISFVITDRIGQREKVGNAVGTLGFADELVALIACPAWGILSDRIGVRTVAVAGYTIVGLSLYVTVQARNVFPELLLARLLFSVGAAATTTMVTAILPSMTLKRPESTFPIERAEPVAPQASTGLSHAMSPSQAMSPSHTQSPSISSELTITPERYSSRTSSASGNHETTKPEASVSKLAGIVGMLTGCGALVALGLFLPLPTRFQNGGISASQSVADSFYVVGAIALAVSVFCFLGLRNLPGEEHKTPARLFRWLKPRGIIQEPQLPSYFGLLSKSFVLGFEDVQIGLGYVGGFVARASSVAISLFIPLYVNAYFIESGLCPKNPGHQEPGIIKQNCQRAYIVASILTGVSQLIALLCAPIFGYLCGIYTTNNLPLLLAAASGVAGYSIFGRMKSPDPSSEEGSIGIFFVVALLGISQIGAIVASLSLLARGIATEGLASTDYFNVPISNGRMSRPMGDGISESEESSPLLPSHLRHIKDGSSSRAALKGSIAGMYSLAGGAGILLLTKVGGLMFDKVDVGSPFFMMAIFNAILFVVALGSDVWAATKAKRHSQTVLAVPSADEDNFRDEG